MQGRHGGFAEDDEDQRLFAFQTLLDGSQYASEPTVDLDRLRRLCSTGIPDHPPHLRPLAYALLLDTLPPEKRRWRSTSAAQRERYYNLVRTFMEELESQPTTSRFTHDDLLARLAKDVKSLKSSFWRSRTNPTRSSPFRPLTTSRPRAASELTSNPAKPARDTREDEHDESGSESGSDGGTDHTFGNGHKRTERITNRRAIFKRIDLLAQVEHRGGFALQPKTRSSDVNNPGTSRVSQQTGPADPQQEQDEEPEEIMSPKITLSVDPGPGGSTILPRLETVRPPPLNTSSLLPSPSTANTIAINASLNSSPDTHKPPSPITLLSPKPLPSGSGSPSTFSGAMYYPDTHLESLIRMLYIFVRTNHQWQYQPSFVDIASNLYLIHTGGRVSLDYAEERTFWALSAFFCEIDQALCLNTDSDSSSQSADPGPLNKLESRLRWANPPFADILHSRNIEPTLYAYRWFSHLFIRDLPLAIVPTLFDFIISELPSAAGSQPKSDLIVDIAVSMVLSLKDRLLTSPTQQREQEQKAKTKSLWGFSESEDQEDEEDANEVFLRNIELLRNYPLKSVGGIKGLLESAARFRYARIQATKQGDDPDKTPRKTLDDRKVAHTKSLPSAGRNAPTSYGGPSLPSSYSWSKASSLFSSLSGIGGGAGSGPSSGHEVPPVTAQSVFSQTRDGPASQSETNGEPSTPGRVSKIGAIRSPQSSPDGQAMPPHINHINPISPLTKKDFAPQANTPSAGHGRERSDSVASSVSSITERLASLTQSTPPAKSQILNGASSPLPRSLLLSGSARRASSSSTVNAFAAASARITLQRRDSSPLPSPRGSPPSSHSNDTGGAVLSPPASIRSPPSGGNVDGNGLYRIGSGSRINGNRQRSRSSLGESESPVCKLSLGTPVTITPSAKENIRSGKEDSETVSRDLDYGAASTPIANSHMDHGEDEPTPIAVSTEVPSS
ncbi:hypothetical protein IAU59_001350 [Kwoniella sp. CBS 9459]